VSLDCFGLQLLEKVEPLFEERKLKCMRYVDYASEYGVGSKDFDLLQL
jgi:hypothetical protein